MNYTREKYICSLHKSKHAFLLEINIYFEHDDVYCILGNYYLGELYLNTAR